MAGGFDIIMQVIGGLADAGVAIANNLQTESARDRAERQNTQNQNQDRLNIARQRALDERARITNNKSLALQKKQNEEKVNNAKKDAENQVKKIHDLLSANTSLGEQSASNQEIENNKKEDIANIDDVYRNPFAPFSE